MVFFLFINVKKGGKKKNHLLAVGKRFKNLILIFQINHHLGLFFTVYCCKFKWFVCKWKLFTEFWKISFSVFRKYWSMPTRNFCKIAFFRNSPKFLYLFLKKIMLGCIGLIELPLFQESLFIISWERVFSTDTKSYSPLPKKLFYLLQWKPFKSDAKCFLFHLKSSFHS